MSALSPVGLATELQSSVLLFFPADFISGWRIFYYISSLHIERDIPAVLDEHNRTDLTQGESRGNNREVNMDKHTVLYVHEWTKQ